MEYKLVPTVCPYCGCGCGILAEVINGKITGVFPQKDHPINQGKLCIKGWNAHTYAVNKERLQKPLKKEGSDFKEASWNEVLKEVADRLGEIRKKYGPDSIAFLCSAKCTNEDNFVIQKFSRAVIGTNNIDHCARL